MIIPVTQSSMHAVYLHRTWLSFTLIVPLNVGGLSLSPVLDRIHPGSKHSRCWATYAPKDMRSFDWVFANRLGVSEGCHKTHLCLASMSRTSEGVGAAGEPDLIEHVN